jgi:hypothetical protein
MSLTQKNFAWEKNIFLACNSNKAMWTSDEVCKALFFLLDNIYVRFGYTLFEKIILIPMGTNCAPMVADLFL